MDAIQNIVFFPHNIIQLNIIKSMILIYNYNMLYDQIDDIHIYKYNMIYDLDQRQ